MDVKSNIAEKVGAWDNPIRTEHDLDSIELGSITKGGKIKIYLNTREDSIDDIEVRIDLLLSGLTYLNSKLNKYEVKE